ncbi:peptidoglycan-binding protein [Streptomyces sp. NPDC001890]|uniref:peptidoglycan-binding domain-containing protein n=1 Tax=Streptomyces sp. NPDC001890 TaxID=3364620 RepID=UPI0036C84519
MRGQPPPHDPPLLFPDPGRRHAPARPGRAPHDTKKELPSRTALPALSGPPSPPLPSPSRPSPRSVPQAPDTATASSSGDPAASAARSAAPASRNQQQWPTLRTGAQGSAVTALQQLLTAHGHSLTADGSFGGLTEAAVQAFQTKQGLQADGVAGPNTWKALVTAPAGARPDTGNTGTGQNATSSPTGYSLKCTTNQKNPMYSTLALVQNGKAVKTYRANSGMGSKDTCLSN